MLCMTGLGYQLFCNLLLDVCQELDSNMIVGELLTVTHVESWAIDAFDGTLPSAVRIDFYAAGSFCGDFTHVTYLSPHAL